MAKRVYTPKDIESKKYECFDWDGEWLSAFGNPAMNSRWLCLVRQPVARARL